MFNQQRTTGNKETARRFAADSGRIAAVPFYEFLFRLCMPTTFCRAILFLATIPLLMTVRPTEAQAPVSGGAGTSVVPGSGAPAATGPASGIAGGVPTIQPGHSLTLAEVVSLAVGGNSGLVVARQRLQKAQELIAQVNAQGRPQIRADAADIYSSYPAFAPTLANPAILNPTLPGGGQIPPVVDQGNGFSTAFIGGGGGGNAPGSDGIFPGTNFGPVPATGGASPGAGIVPIPSPTSAPNPSPATPNPVSPGTTAPGAAFPGQAVPSNLAPTPVVPGNGSTAAPSAAPHAKTPRQGETGTDGGSPVNSVAVSRAVGQRNNYAARLSVSQYIDLFGLLSAARGAQQDVRDFYTLDIQRLQNETALAAKNLFFNLLLAQDQVSTQEEQVRYAQENVRIAESRLRQGIVSRFDVLTAQTALSTAQQQLIAAQDQRDLAQADLSYLLGTDPDQPLALQPPSLPALDQTVDIRQSTQIAQANRPEARQAAANVREANRLVKLAGSPLLPTLGLVASGEDTSTASQTAPRTYASIGAQLAVPLDDGGETRSRVRSAQIDVQTQALTLQQIKLNIALEVRQAALNVRNAQAQKGAAQTGVAQAQEALRLAGERYQAGLGTFLDVLNALAQLARTRTNLSTADYFYQTSLAQLVRAMGGR